MYLAVVWIGGLGLGEGVGPTVAGVERWTYKAVLSDVAGELMDKEGDLVRRLRGLRVAHNKSAEQSTTDPPANVADMVMKWPRTDRLGRGIEHVRPGLSRSDLVASSSVPGTHAERPSAI